MLPGAWLPVQAFACCHRTADLKSCAEMIADSPLAGPTGTGGTLLWVASILIHRQFLLLTWTDFMAFSCALIIRHSPGQKVRILISRPRATAFLLWAYYNIRHGEKTSYVLCKRKKLGTPVDTSVPCLVCCCYAFAASLSLKMMNSSYPFIR